MILFFFPDFQLTEDQRINSGGNIIILLFIEKRIKSIYLSIHLPILRTATKYRWLHKCIRCHEAPSITSKTWQNVVCVMLPIDRLGNNTLGISPKPSLPRGQQIPGIVL